MPEFFYAISLVGYSREERMDIVRAGMEHCAKEHGGIHLVVLDGVADLLSTSNDDIGSGKIGDEEQQLAMRFSTCMANMIHLLSDGSKMRGHTGSELERKCSTVLYVTKDPETGTCKVKVHKCRYDDPNAIGIYPFIWSDEKDYFVFDTTQLDLFPGSSKQYSVKF